MTSCKTSFYTCADGIYNKELELKISLVSEFYDITRKQSQVNILHKNKSWFGLVPIHAERHMERAIV